MNFICSPTYAKFWIKAEKHAKSHDLCNIVKVSQFWGFYSIFCLGRTNNEAHICHLHSKMQLLAKGGYSTKKNYLQKLDWGQSRSQNWRKTLKIFGKNFYTFIIISIKRKSVGGYSRCSTKFCLLWHYLPRYPLSYDSPEMLSNQSPIEPTFI